MATDRRKLKAQSERNSEILYRRDNGETITEIACIYGISRQRVVTICEEQRERLTEPIPDEILSVFRGAAELLHCLDSLDSPY
jgi:hypothetical protein